MQTFVRTLIGGVAAGAMALSAASPAFAQSRYNDRDSGLSAGEVIAGALVIGGIAAIAASAGRDGSRYGDRRDPRWGGDRYGASPRGVVEQCVATATRTASRYSYGGRARVTDIRKVDRKNYGYKVEGRIAVNSLGRAWRSGDGDYGRGWDRDYRGWNRDLRGYDAGRFTCQVDHRGRVMNVKFSGIRGL